MNDVGASYRRYRQALAKINAGNKAALFDALVAANITEMVADFDGEGDQGQIDSIAERSTAGRYQEPSLFNRCLPGVATSPAAGAWCQARNRLRMDQGFSESRGVNCAAS